jgi:hypothetical protein
MQKLISIEELQAEAARRGMPGRTLAQVQECIAKCRRQKSDMSMARLMLRVGRLQPDARAWLEKEYPL